MERSRTVAAIAVLVVLATACGGGSGEDPTTATPTPKATATSTQTGAPPSADGVLKIGTVLPSTGDLAPLGAGMIAAVSMAVRDVNAAGGVLGVDVELAEGDSGTNEDIAGDTVDRLLQSEAIDALIGAASTRVTLAIIERVIGAQVVQCSPSNTGASLSTFEADQPGYFTRTAPSDDLQGPALADVVLGDGASRVAVIALNDEYGQGFAGVLIERLEAGNAEIVANVAYDPAGTDFSADVEQVTQADPDAVVLIGFPETGSAILKGLLEGGIPADRFYSGDGLNAADVVDLVDPDDPTVLNGMKGTAPSVIGSQAFTDAFVEFAGEDTPAIFAAHSYDCVVIVALAAHEAGTDAAAVFHNNMVGITKDGEKCTTFAACKAIIDAGGDVDYDGAAGPGEWVEAGEPATAVYTVSEYRDGENTVIGEIRIGEDG